MDTVIDNLKIVLLTVVILIVMGFLLNFLLKRLLQFLDLKSIDIQNKLAAKITWKYTSLMLEIIFIIIVVLGLLTIIFNNKLLMLLCSLIIIVYTSLLGPFYRYSLNLKDEKIFSIDKVFKYLYEHVNTNNYYISRSILMIKQIFSIDTIISLCLITLILDFFIYLNWPYQAYYIMMLVLPVLINVWVYFSYKKGVNDKIYIDIRRNIIYFLLIIFTVSNNYITYKSYLKIEISLEDSTKFFILNTACIVFIAFDRFFKSWTDDYRTFNESKPKDPNKKTL